MSLVLQLVPVLSMLFLVTSSTGSALWACDMLEGEQGQSGDGAEDGYRDVEYERADAALLA